MNHQPAARNQRPKGFKAKEAFQFAMLLALCIWLLYQFKHSNNNPKVNRVKIHIKLGEEQAATSLGRKGNAAWSSSESDSNSKEEKSDQEEGTYLSENGYSRENVSNHEGREDQKETERQDEESQINEDNNNSNGKFSAIDDENVAKRMREEPQKLKEDHIWTFVPEKDEADRDNNEDKDRIEFEKKISEQHGEIEDGVHGFHDENGVPEDVDHIVESIPNESTADKKNVLFQEMISSSHSESRINEIMLEEGEGKGIANAETETRSTIEDSKSHTAAEAETNSQFNLQNDVTSISHASEV